MRFKLGSLGFWIASSRFSRPESSALFFLTQEISKWSDLAGGLTTILVEGCGVFFVGCRCGAVEDKIRDFRSECGGQNENGRGLRAHLRTEPEPECFQVGR